VVGYFCLKDAWTFFPCPPNQLGEELMGKGGSPTQKSSSATTWEREREDDRYKLVPEAAALSSWPDKKLERVIRDLQEEKSWSKSNTKMKGERDEIFVLLTLYPHKDTTSTTTQSYT
jgi:hypothetical protein